MNILNPIIKEKAWRVFLLALGLNLLLVTVYSYLFVTVRQKNQRLAALTSAVETFNEEKANLKSVKETFSQTASLREQLDGHFIPKDGVVEFLDSIESLGAENNLAPQVLSVSVGPAAPLSPDIFEAVNATVEVGGTWSDVYRFAALVELLPFKVNLGRVDLEKVSGETAAGASKKPSLLAPHWKGTLDIAVLKLK